MGSNRLPVGSRSQFSDGRVVEKKQGSGTGCVKDCSGKPRAGVYALISESLGNRYAGEDLGAESLTAGHSNYSIASIFWPVGTP